MILILKPQCQQGVVHPSWHYCTKRPLHLPLFFHTHSGLGEVQSQNQHQPEPKLLKAIIAPGSPLRRPLFEGVRLHRRVDDRLPTAHNDAERRSQDRCESLCVVVRRLSTPKGRDLFYRTSTTRQPRGALSGGWDKAGHRALGQGPS